MYGCYFWYPFRTLFPSSGIDDTCLQMLQQTAILPLFMCVEQPERCSVPFVSQGWLRQGYNDHQSQQVKRKKRKTSQPLWSKQGDVERGNKNALHAGCLTRPDPGLFPFPPRSLFFRTLQTTAIHCAAILSAFFSFISKLLKTTLWMGRWSTSLLLHAISQHPKLLPPLPNCLPACLHAHLI